MQREDKTSTVTIGMFLKSGLCQIVERRSDWAAFLVIALITLSIKVIFNY